MRTPFKSGSFMLITIILTIWLTACKNSSQNNANNADSTTTTNTDTTINISNPAQYLGSDFHPAPYNCDCTKPNIQGNRVVCARTRCCDSIPLFNCKLFESEKNQNEWKYKSDNYYDSDMDYKCACVIPDAAIKKYKITDDPIEDLEKNYCLYRVTNIMKPGNGGLDLGTRFCFPCDKSATPNCPKVIVIKDQNDRIYYCEAITTNCTLCNLRYAEPM